MSDKEHNSVGYGTVAINMAVTRREFVFGAFLSSVVCILLIILSVSGDSWIRSTATDELQIQSSVSYFEYGLFSGELELNVLETPTYSKIHVTCVFDISVCAASCKTTHEARVAEVRALADKLRPNPACVAVTNIDYTTPLEEPAVISSTFYICFLLLIFLQLCFAIITAVSALFNALKNPTEPIFGLPGCLWSNVITAILGAIVLIMFGVYYATSGLKGHLAFSYIATGLFVASPSLGYSYWIMIGAILCSLLNVGLLELRRYLLEKDPPPPTIKVENHSDGTIFLY